MAAHGRRGGRPRPARAAPRGGGARAWGPARAGDGRCAGDVRRVPRPRRQPAGHRPADRRALLDADRRRRRPGGALPRARMVMRRHQMLRNAYEAALELHLREPGEQTLLAAYELGRRAVAEELGVLELAQLHTDLLVDLVARGAGGEPAEVVAAAGAFLNE